MHQIDQLMQLATARNDPFTQFPWASTPPLPCVWIGAFQRLFIAVPLYRVMVVTPANETTVQVIFASPRELLMSTISILQSRWTRAKLSNCSWLSGEILYQMLNICIYSGTGCHLRMMAMENVIEGTAFAVEVTNVGDVYFKLVKYMFRVNLTLQDQEKVES